MENVKQVLMFMLGWMRQHWLSIILAVVVAVLAFKANQQNKSYNDLFEQMRQQSDDNQHQIDGLRQITQHEQEQQDLLIQQFHQEISRIETEYHVDLDRIAAQRSARQVQIVHDFSTDPTTLTAATNQIFGIPVQGQ